MAIDIAIKYAKLPHGLVYFYQHWISREPRALIIFIHGLGDHIGRYGRFISRLANHGYACALFDQRGHGRSEGRRGHVEHFSDWVSDLASFVQFSQIAVPTDTPLYLIGTSLGALIGLNFLLTHTAPVEGMITLSAAIEPIVRIPNWKKKMLCRISKFFPNHPLDIGIRPEELTRDVEELKSLKNDPFFHSLITLSAAEEIEKNLDLVMAMPHRIHIPCLMLAGSADSICDPDGTRQFALRLSSADKRYHICTDGYHDLLHDMCAEEVMSDIEEWLERRLASRAPLERQYSLHRRETLWENISLPSS